MLKQRDREAITDFALGQGTVADDFDRWVDVAAWNEDRAVLAALYTVLLAEGIDSSHPVHAYMQERNATVRELLRSTLQHGVERGELRKDINVNRKADEIQAFMEGAQLSWLYVQKKRALTPHRARVPRRSTLANAGQVISRSSLPFGARSDDSIRRRTPSAACA